MEAPRGAEPWPPLLLDVPALEEPTVFAHRNPMLLLRFVGLLLLRFGGSKFDVLLLKLPPRITRLELHDLPSLDCTRSQTRLGSNVSWRLAGPPCQRTKPPADHPPDLQRLAVEVRLLVERDCVQGGRKAGEHAGTHQPA